MATFVVGAQAQLEVDSLGRVSVIPKMRIDYGRIK